MSKLRPLATKQGNDQDTHSLVRQQVKNRLVKFLDSDDGRMILRNLKDARTLSRQELIDQLLRSEQFQRWKRDMLLDMELETAKTNIRQRRNLWSSMFGHRYSSTLSSLDSQSDSDDEQRQYLTSGASCLLSSSLNASTFAFLGKNYLKQVIDSLIDQHKEDIEEKCDSLRALLQLPASEIYESEYWTDFKRTLRLLHNYESRDGKRICDHTLAILIKLFNSSNHTVQFDSFVILVDHLKEDLFDEMAVIISVKNGRRLNFNDSRHVYVLRKMQVLNEMCLHFVRSLPRYSQQLLMQISEKMIGLIDFEMLDNGDSENSRYLNPFLCWSILDPQMKWWRNWMHARIGRVAVLSALDRHPKVVEFLFQRSFGMENSKIQNNQLDAIEVVAARNMVEHLLLYEECRDGLVTRFSLDIDGILDRLFGIAVETANDKNFAWKILFRLNSTCKGRRLIFTEKRLRKIGLELLRKDNGYQVKIKLLNLISNSLKSANYDSFELMDRFVELGEEKTFLKIVMGVISELIKAAYSREPEAPLSLVYACFDLCTNLCSMSSGRSLVAQYDEFLMYALKLVKEHSVELNFLLPVLTSIGIPIRRNTE